VGAGMTDLDELSRLLQQATPGPWQANGPELIQKVGDIRLIVCDSESELCQQDAALIAALRNHAEELVKDARRYRWLRNVAWGETGGVAPAVCMVDRHGCPCVDDDKVADPILEGWELDATIDAHIAQEQPNSSATLTGSDEGKGD